MINKKSPCKGCQKRHKTCHAECEEYKKWRRELTEYNYKVKKENNDEGRIISYTVDTIMKNKKQKRISEGMGRRK